MLGSFTKESLKHTWILRSLWKFLPLRSCDLSSGKHVRNTGLENVMLSNVKLNSSEKILPSHTYVGAKNNIQLINIRTRQ